MKLLLALLILFAGVARADDPIRPDPALTPGAIMRVPIRELMAPGYANGHAHDGIKTKGARDVSESLKHQVFIRYMGKVPEHPGEYEVDHLIPVCIGGANTIENLWPEKLDGPQGAKVKDKLEVRMLMLLRREYITHGPKAASSMRDVLQYEVSHDWTAAYHKYCEVQ